MCKQFSICINCPHSATDNRQQAIEKAALCSVYWMKRKLNKTMSRDQRSRQMYRQPTLNETNILNCISLPHCSGWCERAVKCLLDGLIASAYKLNENNEHACFANCKIALIEMRYPKRWATTCEKWNWLRIFFRSKRASRTTLLWEQFCIRLCIENRWILVKTTIFVCIAYY